MVFEILSILASGCCVWQNLHNPTDENSSFSQIVLAACSKFFAEIFSANGVASDRSFIGKSRDSYKNET